MFVDLHYSGWLKHATQRLYERWQEIGASSCGPAMEISEGMIRDGSCFDSTISMCTAAGLRGIYGVEYDVQCSSESLALSIAATEYWKDTISGRERHWDEPVTAFDSADLLDALRDTFGEKTLKTADWNFRRDSGKFLCQTRFLEEGSRRQASFSAYGRCDQGSVINTTLELFVDDSLVSSYSLEKVVLRPFWRPEKNELGASLAEIDETAEEISNLVCHFVNGFLSDNLN